MSKRWTRQDLPSLQGKLAIVTGANSGLGLETAVGLAQAGAAVIMACRDPRRAGQALAEVRQRAPEAAIETLALDLADLASVRRFAEAVRERHARLDLLCNNAGVMHLSYRKTRDGFEMQIGTNHLGHFALTGLLLPALEAAPAARVVTVASVAHRVARGFDPDDLNWERQRYDKAQAYARSKLANLLFHFELQRRLQRRGSRVLALAAHPGYAATNIGFADGQQTPLWKRWGMTLGNLLFAQSAAMGALPTLYAATQPDLRSGDYIGPDGFLQFRGHPVAVDCRPLARDAALAARLWERSEQLTGLRYP